MHRPELVRSWASDVLGIFDADYVWHDMAQVWQTPGAGEELITTMISGTVRERSDQLAAWSSTMTSQRRWLPRRTPTWIGRFSPCTDRRHSPPPPTPVATSRLPQRDRGCPFWPPRTPSWVRRRYVGGRPIGPARAPKCSSVSVTGGWSRIRLAPRRCSPGSGIPSSRSRHLRGSRCRSSPGHLRRGFESVEAGGAVSVLDGGPGAHVHFGDGDLPSVDGVDPRRHVRHRRRASC